MACRANEKVLLVYDDHHHPISWQWIHLDRGVISFEKALSECPNLAFDLDIFLSLDKTTLSFKNEEARKKYEE